MYIKKDNWGSAHDIADGPEGQMYHWIHALLHRIEGDKWNAGYWYRRAGKPYPTISIDEEWEEIVNAVFPVG